MPIVRRSPDPKELLPLTPVVLHILALEGVTRGPAMLERAVSLARQSLDRLLPPR